jgi:deoxyribodipyrimidine photolyase-related protein
MAEKRTSRSANKAPIVTPHAVTDALPDKVRNLVLVLGDQLDAESSALRGFDPAQDVVWMAEVAEESTHVWSAKQRIAVFLSAMRHFAEDLRARGLPLIYTRLDDSNNSGTLALELGRAIAQWQPAGLVLTAPGDWRVLQSLRAVASQNKLPLELRDDTLFSAPCATLPPTPKAASNCAWSTGIASCAVSTAS